MMSRFFKLPIHKDDWLDKESCFRSSETEVSSIFCITFRMENNVIQLEAGNLEADDSEVKQKYDNQKQLNIQLSEQKRWLEHELEQIKLKIQNEKMNLVPDPFALDWDALSETEMKRLVVQLEKTRNDLRSDLRYSLVFPFRVYF